MGDDVKTATLKGILRTDTDTRDETTGKDVIVGTTVGRSLNNDTDAEDNRGDEHAELAAESIGEDTVGEYTDPSTEFKNRGDQTGDGGVVDALDARGPSEAVHCENLAKHALVVTIHKSSVGCWGLE